MKMENKLKEQIEDTVFHKPRGDKMVNELYELLSFDAKALWEENNALRKELAVLKAQQKVGDDEIMDFIDKCRTYADDECMRYEFSLRDGINVFRSHFKQPTAPNTGAVWVKASDKTPNETRGYNLKYNGQPDLALFDKETDEFYSDVTKHYKLQKSMVEWLDETPVSITDTELDKWISVEDRLPEPNQKVDLWVVPEDEEKSHRMQWTWENGNGKDTRIGGQRITHWMPRPAPPKANPSHNQK